MARSSHLDRLSPPFILSALFRAPFFQQWLLQAVSSLGQSYSRSLLGAPPCTGTKLGGLWLHPGCLSSHSLAPAGLSPLPTSSLCLFGRQGERGLCVGTAHVCPARTACKVPQLPQPLCCCHPLLWHTGGALGCPVVLGSKESKPGPMEHSGGCSPVPPPRGWEVPVPVTV